MNELQVVLFVFMVLLMQVGYDSVPTFDGVSDISNPNGFIITVGKINSSGIVSNTINYFHFQSVDNANVGNINGGGSACSAGPVNLVG
jgi:hypothetical protein